MAKINPLIALAIPTWGRVSTTWARALRHIGGPLGANMVELSPTVGEPIAEARNALMMEAISSGCDYLFFLGDDVLAPADVIHRLLQRMWDHPEINIVTGVYWTKTWPTQPYIWRGIQRGPYMDWKHGEFFELDYAGCDCLLIRLTPEMKALGPDWFSTDWKWDDGEKALNLLATEDFYFYTKARKAGMKVWCDSNVQCLHEDRLNDMQFGLTTEMPQYGAEDPELADAETDIAPVVKLADIGAGRGSPYFGSAENVKVVRFDDDEDSRPDYRCDIRHLPVEDQSFDMVHSRHVLEHFGREEVMKVLHEWTRILRVGGEFTIMVPNLLTAMKQIIAMEEGTGEPDYYPFWQVYGRNKGGHDFHRNGFTPKRLQLLLERLDIFEDIEIELEGDKEDNIIGKAKKVRHPEPYALLPVWDEIEQQEGIKVPGFSANGASDEEVPVATPEEVAVQ
jgi:predicted SAM-dependent methyltransferase